MKPMLSGVPQPRFGVKGKAAAAWLAAQGLALPQQPNSWIGLADGSLILRLGRGEYLAEGAAARQLHTAWKNGMPDVYQVPRYDAGFLLAGEGMAGVMAEICALDTRPELVGDGVLMTLAAGISVTLICDTHEGVPAYRLWCDATYGDYMQGMLREILG
jgi:sarcosine oxidase subunit gamma